MKGYDREKSLDREVYFSEQYFAYRQLWSFAEQIHHIHSLKPKKMIEIGIGNGFVSEFMKTMGVEVKTFDVNPKLKPDVVAPVQELGHFVEPNEFDLIACCEVLEHLPFEEFEQSLQRFSMLSSRLFLTLPVYGDFLGFGGFIRLPMIRKWNSFWIKIPFHKGPLSQMHYWEVDYNHATSKRAIVRLLKHYYATVETGLFKANPYHRYFKCIGSRTRS